WRVVSSFQGPLSMGSFVEKQFALHKLVDEAADAVIAGTGTFEDSLYSSPIGEADWCAGGIDRQLLGQVAGELLFVGEQELFELADVAELPAVGEFAAGVHWQPVVKGEFLPA